MRAVVYDIRPAGWLATALVRPIWPGVRFTRLNGLSLREMPEPSLPGDDWVLCRPLLGGICGTDVSIINQEPRPNSPLQAFGSMPMALGHENVSVVERVGPGVEASWRGRRVCVEPTLCCRVRGIDPPCDRCAAGEFGACENFGAAGGGRYRLPAGTSIGYNAATGGSWGERFVAHVSQLVPVPEELSDEQAVLVDPLACSLHAVLRADLSGAEQVLVYGCGLLGLGVSAMLRAAGFAGRIDAITRRDAPGRRAVALGADEAFALPRDPMERGESIARRTGGTVQPARFGNYLLSGGYDVVFDCVGSADSLADALRWTRARGQIGMVATAREAKLDLTGLWFRELSVFGVYGRQDEHWRGQRRSTYSLVLELLAGGGLDVGRLVTHTFGLTAWRQALRVALNKADHDAVRVVFDHR